jgi:hypothetical protein
MATKQKGKKRLRTIFGNAAWATLIVGGIGAPVTLGVMTAVGHTNPAMTTRAAEEMGFSHINITGKGSFDSCDNKHENGDWYRTKFSAVGKSGLPVTGVVCDTPGFGGDGTYVHINSVAGISSRYVGPGN